MARKSPTASTSNCSRTARYSQVLVGDRGDGDVDDLHLVLAHQVQEQVQRAAEDVQIDAKIHQRDPAQATRVWVNGAAAAVYGAQQRPGPIAGPGGKLGNIPLVCFVCRAGAT